MGFDRDEAGRPIGIASDHGGLRLKAELIEVLGGLGVPVDDLGTDSTESVDYPDFAKRVVDGLTEGRLRAGILVCGTGLGMSMKANRYHGVRAAVCTSTYMARMARAHNDANVLCLGERVIGPGEAEDILRAFLETDFEAGRHTRRIGKFDQ